MGISKVDFVKVDSPRFYNYSTDECVANVTFNKEKFINFVIENTNRELFDKLIRDKFTSRDGYWNFHSNDPDEWMTNLIHKVDESNVVLEIFLGFFTENNDEAVLYETLENINEYIEYFHDE